MSLSVGQNGAKLLEAAGPIGAARPASVHDQDRYWKAGLIYVNPDDPAYFVPKLFGVGVTINWGNRKAVAATVAFLVVFTAALVALVVVL